MKLLAIETSTPYSSIALLEGKKPVISLVNHKPFYHVEKLPSLVEQILKITGWKLDELSFIAVSIGPGFFTGLRAGVSYARGLAMGLSIPILPISTLEVIYREIGLENVEICLKLKGSKVFHQRFENGKPASKVVFMPVEEIEMKYPVIIKEDYVRADLLGIIAYEKFIEAAQKLPSLEEIEPLYVQPPPVHDKGS